MLTYFNMKQSKVFLSLIPDLFFAFTTQAQSSVNASGGKATGTGGAMSYSVVEEDEDTINTILPINICADSTNKCFIANDYSSTATLCLYNTQGSRVLTKVNTW